MIFRQLFDPASSTYTYLLGDAGEADQGRDEVQPNAQLRPVVPSSLLFAHTAHDRPELQCREYRHAGTQGQQARGCFCLAEHTRSSLRLAATEAPKPAARQDANDKFASTSDGACVRGFAVAVSHIVQRASTRRHFNNWHETRSGATESVRPWLGR